MTKELPLIGSVRKQCGGTCWLHAGVVAQEHRISKTLGEPTSLSAEYLITRAAIDRFAKAVIEGPSTTESIIPEIHVAAALGRSLTNAEIKRLTCESAKPPFADSGSAPTLQATVNKCGTIPDKNFSLGPEAEDFADTLTHYFLGTRFDSWIRYDLFDENLSEELGSTPKLSFDLKKHYQDSSTGISKKLCVYAEVVLKEKCK